MRIFPRSPQSLPQPTRHMRSARPAAAHRSELRSSSAPRLPVAGVFRQRSEELVHLMLGLFFRDSVTLLYLPHELLTPALDYLEIAVCQLSPLLLYFPGILFPFSFNLFPVHLNLRLVVRRTADPGHARSVD